MPHVKKVFGAASRISFNLFPFDLYGDGAIYLLYVCCDRDYDGDDGDVVFWLLVSGWL